MDGALKQLAESKKLCTSNALFFNYNIVFKTFI